MTRLMGTSGIEMKSTPALNRGELTGFRIIQGVEVMSDEEFSERLRELIKWWETAVHEFWKSYEERCALIYEIHKETSKPGCQGKFSAVLRRIKLPASTAFDMITRHKIKIGEMVDPDAHDSRDDEEEGAEQDEESGDEEDEEKSEVGDTRKESRRNARPRRPRGPSSKVTLALSGTIREAVDGIQAHYHKTNAKEVVTFCVLRVWGELTTPVANRKDEPITKSRPKGTLIFDYDDALDEIEVIGTPKPAASDYMTPEAGGAADGAA
jgi:hypothetical protein